MQAAGIGGISLAGLPAMGSAESGAAEPLKIGSLSLSGGVIDNSQTYEIQTDFDSDVKSQVQSNGGKILTDVDVGRGISALNKAKRSGNVEFTEEEGVVKVSLTERGQRVAEQNLDQVGALHSGDGKNDYEENPFSIPPNIKVWTDDDTTDAIVSGTLVVSGLLGSIGATGTVPAAIAGVILATSAGLISTANEGSGVIFNFNVVPVPPIGPVVPTLSSQ